MSTFLNGPTPKSATPEAKVAWTVFGYHFSLHFVVEAYEQKSLCIHLGIRINIFKMTLALFSHHFQFVQPTEVFELIGTIVIGFHRIRVCQMAFSS